MPDDHLSACGESDECCSITSTPKDKVRRKNGKEGRKSENKTKIQPKKVVPRPEDKSESTDNSTIATQSGVFSCETNVAEKVWGRQQ